MRTITAIALIAALAGCGKPEDKFVGTWDGRMEIPQATIDEAEKQFPGMGGAMAEQAAKQKLLVELKKDGSYSLTVTGVGAAQSVTGTWTLSEDGKTLSFSPPELSEADKQKAKDQGATDEMLKPNESQRMNFTVADDKKTLTYEQTQMGMSGTLTLTKR